MVFFIIRRFPAPAGSGSPRRSVGGRSAEPGERAHEYAKDHPQGDETGRLRLHRGTDYPVDGGQPEHPAVGGCRGGGGRRAGIRIHLVADQQGHGGARSALGGCGDLLRPGGVCRAAEPGSGDLRHRGGQVPHGPHPGRGGHPEPWLQRCRSDCPPLPRAGRLRAGGERSSAWRLRDVPRRQPIALPGAAGATQAGRDGRARGQPGSGL